MDLSRKIGIGIVMIIPTFVGAGAVWGVFGSWIGVIIWIILMGYTYKRILSGMLANE